MIVVDDCVKEIKLPQLVKRAQHELVVVDAKRRTGKSQLAKLLAAKAGWTWVVESRSIKDYWRGKAEVRILSWDELITSDRRVLQGTSGVVYDDTPDPRSANVIATGVWITDRFWDQLDRFDMIMDKVLQDNVGLNDKVSPSSETSADVGSILMGFIDTARKAVEDDDEWRHAIQNASP